MAKTRKRTGGSRIQAALHGREGTLLDLVDSLIDRGVLLNADLTLGLANVDLVYIKLSALMAAADRVLGEQRPAADRVIQPRPKDDEAPVQTPRPARAKKTP